MAIEKGQYRIDWPFVTFGTGVVAQAVDRTPHTNDEGVEGEFFTMALHAKLMRKYAIKESDLSRDGYIKRWYPKKYIVHLASDEIVVLCGFQGETPTPLTAYPGIILKENLDMRKEIQYLKLRITSLQEELYYLSSEEAEGIRRTVDKYKDVMSLRGKIDELTALMKKPGAKEVPSEE